MTTMKKQLKPSLGQGLSVLLGPESETHLKEIPIHQLTPGKYQPRTYIDPTALAELANSIKENGLIQPIIVRKVGNQAENKFEIIAGERRWHAAKAAGKSKIPVVIKMLSDKQSLEMALVENIQRTDLNPLEEAKGYERLMQEFNYTQEMLGEVLSKSRSHIANILRLLKLPESVQKLVSTRKISAGHARALLTVPDPAKAAEAVIKGRLNVRQTEGLGRKAQKPSGRNIQKEPQDQDILGIQQMVSDLIGLPVHITIKNSGGVVKIQYESFDHLDKFLSIVSQGSSKIL